MQERQKHEEHGECRHALLMNTEDDTEIPYWDCTHCGAVAFFNPGTNQMLIPRES